MADWPLAAKARNDFADMIETLDADQLNEQSLCSEWTAQGVLCHLTSLVETSLGGFFINMAKSGFNFEKGSLVMADKQMQRPLADVIASLRSKAAKSAALPSFPEAMTVSDVAIHTQDVRRGLGLEGALDPEVLSTALEFITTNKKAKILVDRRPIDSVRLVATDNDWSFGSGPEITGTAEALLMGIANRPVLADLAGPGLSNWNG